MKTNLRLCDKDLFFFFFFWSLIPNLRARTEFYTSGLHRATPSGKKNYPLEKTLPGTKEPTRSHWGRRRICDEHFLFFLWFPTPTLTAKLLCAPTKIVCTFQECNTAAGLLQVLCSLSLLRMLSFVSLLCLLYLPAFYACYAYRSCCYAYRFFRYAYRFCRYAYRSCLLAYITNKKQRLNYSFVVGLKPH